MPRYLLFGETIDMAAKLESSGESMKVQISDVTANYVLQHGRFKIQARDKAILFGSSAMQTYWLLSMADPMVNT